MRQIVWLSTALFDLEEVYIYVNECDPYAAFSMVIYIQEVSEQLSEQPYLGRTAKTPNTRRLVVPGTQYIIWYRYQPDEQIEIIRVIHSAQNSADKI